MNFRTELMRALDTFFPKGQSDERSKAMMLYASAVMAYKRHEEQTLQALSHLLGAVTDKSRHSEQYMQAMAYYLELRKHSQE